jgi:hypothetical protein
MVVALAGDDGLSITAEDRAWLSAAQQAVRAAQVDRQRQARNVPGRGCLSGAAWPGSHGNRPSRSS